MMYVCLTFSFHLWGKWYFSSPAALSSFAEIMTSVNGHHGHQTDLFGNVEITFYPCSLR